MSSGYVIAENRFLEQLGYKTFIFRKELEYMFAICAHFQGKGVFSDDAFSHQVLVSKHDGSFLRISFFFNLITDIQRDTYKHALTEMMIMMLR